MTDFRIARVEPIGPACVRVHFEDGFSGEYDLTDLIRDRPLFARLRDPAVFSQVMVDARGQSFGWFLDALGHEIDFGAGSVRAQLEREVVQALAARYDARLHAAE